jgi:hypothetical protein
MVRVAIECDIAHPISTRDRVRYRLLSLTILSGIGACRDAALLTSSLLLEQLLRYSRLCSAAIE